MDIARIFAILGIEETKDEEQIRQAYRMKLTTNNPEDDPEGFRRLREAYEQAITYARKIEEDTAKEEDTSPVGLWMKQVEEVYRCLPKRLNVQVWQELFRDEICVDLEYAEEVKWRLFRFLAEHYRLNSEIYRVLDSFFGIQEGEKEFKEHLPIAFVDYMIRKIQDTEGEEDFPYQWIQGADTADYDEFQNRLYELEELLSEEKIKEAEEVVTVMEQLGIEHPYYQVAKARLAVQRGEKEAALIAGELLEEYQENAKIQVLSAEVLWNCGEKEKAAEAFQHIREKFGIYYIVEKYLAEYEKEQGNLFAAIDHCILALQKAEDETLEKMREELDEAYIEKCKQELEAGTLTKKDAEHVCGSYIRSGQIQEGIDFILGHPEYVKDIEYIHSYLSVLYFRAEKYEESIQECQVWREEFLEQVAKLAAKGEDKKAKEGNQTDKGNKENDADKGNKENDADKGNKEDDANKEDKTDKEDRADKTNEIDEDEGKEKEKEKEDTEKDKIDKYRLDIAVSHFYEGRAICALAEQNRENGISDGYTYQDARQAVEHALSYAPNNTDMKQYLLDLLIKERAYERAIELADELLSWNGEWFPALVQKQKACYELGRAQEVIDLFYQAREVFAGYAPIYELAVRVFCDYKQYQDAERILERAKEADVHGFGLDIAELRCQRMQCRSDVSYYDAVKKGEELLKKLNEGKAKKQQLAELYFELAILEDCQYYQEFMHPGKAEEYIKKAIALRENEPKEEVAPYYYTCGHIFYNAGKYQEALEAYQTYVDSYQMTEMAAMNLAQCYNELGEWENAIRLYQEAISINPNQKDANGEIAAIYKREGDKRGSVPLIQKALPYENRQIELKPESAYHYRVRGIIYKMLGDLEKALEDTEKAIQLDKKNPYGLNLKGRILYYMGKYQQSLFYYKKSIANLKDPKTEGWAMYTNAAESCQKMGNFAEAEEWYRKGIALFEEGDQAWCYWELVQLYKAQGRYKEAISLLKESSKKGNMTEERYYLRYFGIKRILCHNIEAAKELEREALKAAKKLDTIDIWEEVSDIQYYYMFDGKRARKTKKMVMNRLEEEKADWWKHQGKLIERMRIYFEIGKQQEVEKWGRIYIEAIEGHYGIDTEEYPAVEQYLNDPNEGYENLCNMIYYWMFTGQMELALEGMERARGMRKTKCRDCRQCDCVVFEEVEATYWEIVGETERAYRQYCEIYERWQAASLAYYKMGVLKKKGD